MVLSLGSAAAEFGFGTEVDAQRPDPYASLHAVEIRLTLWVQQWQGLGKVMEGISHLGPGRPMLALALVLLCVVGPRFAGRFAVLLLVCLWLRELLAMVLQSPRPYWYGDPVQTFRDPPLDTPTFGLPSGHATAAAAVWFFLAAEVRRCWAWVLAALIVMAVGVSRVYLGLHFASDVVLGVLLGAGNTAVFRSCEDQMGKRWTAMDPRARRVAAAGVGLAVLVITAAVQRWVAWRVSAEVWPPFGATARLSTGAVWSAGALFGVAWAGVKPVVWAVERDCWRWRGYRMALAAAPAALYLARPSGWRLSSFLPAQPEAVRWGIQFAAATFLGWAALSLLPAAFRRFGWAPRADVPAATTPS